MQNKKNYAIEVQMLLFYLKNLLNNLMYLLKVQK